MRDRRKASGLRASSRPCHVAAYREKVVWRVETTTRGLLRREMGKMTRRADKKRTMFSALGRFGGPSSRRAHREDFFAVVRRRQLEFVGRSPALRCTRSWNSPKASSKSACGEPERQRNTLFRVTRTLTPQRPMRRARVLT